MRNISIEENHNLINKYQKPIIKKVDFLKEKQNNNESIEIRQQVIFKS